MDNTLHMIRLLFKFMYIKIKGNINTPKMCINNKYLYKNWHQIEAPIHIINTNCSQICSFAKIWYIFGEDYGVIGKPAE